MEKFRRYAIYDVPDGPMGGFGRSWLGWDLEAGLPAPYTVANGLPKPLRDLVAAATPYGFHATLKPPFKLADGQTETDLRAAMTTLAARLAPVRLDGLELADLDGFLALTAQGDLSVLNALAAHVVRDPDHFRAPQSDAELARRRAHGLTVAQEANLTRWGYPFVMDQFGFHITLTGRLTPPHASRTRAVLTPLVAPFVNRPYTIADLALVGQMDNGGFKLIHRYRLSG